MTWRHALDTASENAANDGRFANEYPRFAPISSEAFNNFTDLPARFEVAAGTRLLEQGTTPKNVLLVFEGLLRLDYLNPDGTEIMLGLRTSGWYPGASSVMTKVPSVYSVTAVGPCSIAAIPAEEFWCKLMQNTPASWALHLYALPRTDFTGRHAGTTHVEQCRGSLGMLPAGA